jgi:hypothetical protein
VEILPGLIARKVEALEFKLGYGQYYAPAIKTYFESLFDNSLLHAIVVDGRDGTLFGVYNAASSYPAGRNRPDC